VDLVQLGKMDFRHKQHPQSKCSSFPEKIWYNSFFIEPRVAIMTLLTVTDYLCHRWPCICFICHSHNPVFFHISWHHWNLKSRITRRLSVVQQKMLSREPDLIPDFLWGFHCPIFSFLCSILWINVFFFLLALCCLSFNLQILITSLVSSNFSLSCCVKLNSATML